MLRLERLVFPSFLAVAACVGNIGGEPGGSISDDAAAEVARSGARRLSTLEYRATVFDLLGYDPVAAPELLPADTLAPFDNDYRTQTPSEALIKGAEVLAGDIADAVTADPALRVAATGCDPQSPADAACFRSFIETFGRRALRRPLTGAEIEAFTTLSEFSVETSDFWTGVNAALRAFLQHPEFLYRIEVGEPVAGRPDYRELDAYEIGARLSYFLLGTTPPDWLLDAAEDGSLSSPEGVSAAAESLLEDDRAKWRIARFHAMWLSYAQLTDEGISGMMHAETKAMLDRVVFEERRPWSDILTMSQTFVTPELAAHYGLPSPGAEAGWVSTEGTGRKGLFSQGTFLSAVSKFGDTSPTQRGLLVRARLFCQPIDKPPPELEVNVDMPPTVADPDACKQERYFMAQEDACKSCHQLMDPIGFGLENFGADGRYRETEPDRPECVISGDGNFEGVGTFNGPAELAELAVESGLVEACVAKQLYRFAVGRSELDEHDEAFIARLVEESSAEGGLELLGFISTYVGSEAFRFRRDEVSK